MVTIESKHLSLVHMASEDITRQQLNGIWINFKESCIEATDGHIAIYESINIEEQYRSRSDFFIPINVCKALIRSKTKFVHINDTNVQDDNLTSYNCPQSDYKNVNRMITKYYQSGTKQIESICFNPDLLSRVGKAMRLKKGKGFKVMFAESGPMVATNNEFQGKALIMPMRDM